MILRYGAHCYLQVGPGAFIFTIMEHALARRPWRSSEYAAYEARARRRTRSGHAATRRLPPSARSSVMSAAIFETGSKATTTPVAPAVPRVFAFFRAGGAVNRR